MSNKLPQIVLVNPEIPQNTGNIARTTAALYTTLHLIKPLGFELSDKYLKRAGLDYWAETDVRIYENWEEFIARCSPKNIWIFTTKSDNDYSKVIYNENDYLVFGCETKGLSEFFHKSFEKQKVKIPIDNPNIRSINLATAVAIALYCARAQNT